MFATLIEHRRVRRVEWEENFLIINFNFPRSCLPLPFTISLFYFPPLECCCRCCLRNFLLLTTILQLMKISNLLLLSIVIFRVSNMLKMCLYGIWMWVVHDGAKKRRINEIRIRESRWVGWWNKTSRTRTMNICTYILSKTMSFWNLFA